MYIYDIICTFKDKEQIRFNLFLYENSDQITEELFIKKILDKLYINEIRSLIKLDCSQFYTDNCDLLYFINNRNGKFYFNSIENNDLDTIYWNKFKLNYISNKKRNKLIKYGIISSIIIFGLRNIFI